ncbi:MAG: 16S rRNA (cytosine(1402)-N(4))-methyltransferase RsmH [Patescibacteria group bacterium]|jgi:16S rRNA (cytosine1402-N4)-methyltransferase
MKYQHTPVMLKEVIEQLAPESGGIYVDGTLGGASYTLEIARLVGPSGKVVSFDLDEAAIANAKELLAKEKIDNVILINNNFKNLTTELERVLPGKKLDGLVLDLGLSSAQLADGERGFSFLGDYPLDMRFGPKSERTAEEIVNEYSLEELTRVFRDYGEEKRAYQIAKAIVKARRTERITTTAKFLEVMGSTIPFKYYSRINPATKVFQALRIETNDELNSLTAVLAEALKLLKIGGRITVVSFHSGEDRIVKRFFKNNDQLLALSKKPLIASETEVALNPRSRSAKLRSAIKI